MPTDGASGRRVGEVTLGPTVQQVVERAASLLDGPAARDVAQALADSYRTSETYGSAFGKLLARLFAGRGLILLDPLSPKLHRLAAPVYRAAIERNGELNRELIARKNALERARLHSQVKVTERNTLVFISVDGERLALRTRGAGFALGEKPISQAEVLDLLARSPEVFSPNVLLRPVVQDTLLPTAAYVAGAAEIAYYAQASVVYARLLGRMPVIMPRASFTLVDPRIVRVLRKYDLDFQDILRGERHLRAKMERALLPRTLARRFDAAEKSIHKLLEVLREPVATLDRTLLGAIDTTEKSMLHQFSTLRAKISRAAAFRAEVINRHERELLGWLYPNGGLQERSLCLLPMLALHGAGLLDELMQRSTPGGSQHRVLYL